MSHVDLVAVVDANSEVQQGSEGEWPINGVLTVVYIYRVPRPVFSIVAKRSASLEAEYGPLYPRPY